MQGYNKPLAIALIVISCVLMGCKTQTVQSRHGTAYDQIQQSLTHGVVTDKALAKKSLYVPTTVSNALLSSSQLSNQSDDSVAERRFDVSTDKTPVKEFYMGLVEGTPYNIVVNPNVKGTVSLHLKNVTIEEAMDATRDVYGYEYHKTSFGYEIMPQEMETRIYNVNYLDVNRVGKSLTKLNSGEITEKVNGMTTGFNSQNQMQNQNQTRTLPQSGSSIDTRSQMNFWRDLDTTLKTMVGTRDGRSVMVNAQAGLVIVHAFPAELHQVARYLSRTQSSIGRQVILEAKILEVQLKDEFQSGINWSLFGNTLQQTSNVTFPGADLKDFTSIFTLQNNGSFINLIKLLQTQGNVQVLSSPRISTVNNQKAVIKVGQDEFFVTGVSTENTITPNSTIPTQDVNLTPFFSGITLDVTPQISGKGGVILHIHPSISLVKEQQKRIVLGQTVNNTNNTLELPLALSTIRESDNIVRAQNGQIVVIGGLMQNDMREDTAGTPGLAKIPFIGTLFRRTQQQSTKTELVILLRPILVEKETWTRDMNRSAQSMATLRRGFHVGGLPGVFGTEGERE